MARLIEYDLCICYSDIGEPNLETHPCTGPVLERIFFEVVEAILRKHEPGNGLDAMRWAQCSFTCTRLIRDSVYLFSKWLGSYCESYRQSATVLFRPSPMVRPQCLLHGPSHSLLAPLLHRNEHSRCPPLRPIPRLWTTSPSARASSGHG